MQGAMAPTPAGVALMSDDPPLPLLTDVHTESKLALEPAS